MFAELPVGVEDPAQRLESIRTQMADLKESKQAVAGEVLTSLSGFAPPLLLALGARLGSKIPQRSINTGTTNVPGPQYPLYAAGRRMLESFPYVPLFGQIRLAVAVFSYTGRSTSASAATTTARPTSTSSAPGSSTAWRNSWTSPGSPSRPPAKLAHANPRSERRPTSRGIDLGAITQARGPGPPWRGSPRLLRRRSSGRNRAWPASIVLTCSSSAAAESSARRG
jgi:hypothetical protein